MNAKSLGVAAAMVLPAAAPAEAAVDDEYDGGTIQDRRDADANRRFEATNATSIFGLIVILIIFVICIPFAFAMSLLNRKGVVLRDIEGA
jgi:hypothetical protein